MPRLRHKPSHGMAPPLALPSFRAVDYVFLWRYKYRLQYTQYMNSWYMSIWYGTTYIPDTIARVEHETQYSPCMRKSKPAVLGIYC